VVIPLPRMGEYTDGIERINIELSLRNKLELVDALQAFFAAGSLPLGRSDDAGEIPSAELLEDRVQQALALLARCARCGSSGWTTSTSWTQPRGGETCFALLQDHRCAPAGRRRSSSRCSSSSPARLQAGLDECRAIHKEVLRGRVWVALHMHAGDGNVHTNIPVNSDNYAMLQTAHEAVARIMALARSWAA
jgi:FAD/FMN-containing dehydrogenase